MPPDPRAAVSVSPHELPAIHPPRLVDVSVESSPFRKITQSALARLADLGYVLVLKARNDMQVWEWGKVGFRRELRYRSE